MEKFQVLEKMCQDTCCLKKQWIERLYAYQQAVDLGKLRIWHLGFIGPDVLCKTLDVAIAAIEIIGSRPWSF